MFGTLTASPVYAYHDHLGTPRRWRLGNKSIARTYEYDPYGNIYAGSGIFTTIPRIYALHEFDMGLQQYRAPFRHYRPTMARWTTLDPLGMIDGPNMYAYVGGRPIQHLDIFGLEQSSDSDRPIDLEDIASGRATRNPCDEEGDKCQDACMHLHKNSMGKEIITKLDKALKCCLTACNGLPGGTRTGRVGKSLWEYCLKIADVADKKPGT